MVQNPTSNVNIAQQQHISITMHNLNSEESQTDIQQLSHLSLNQIDSNTNTLINNRLEDRYSTYKF
jgi:hypothetical protein